MSHTKPFTLYGQVESGYRRKVAIVLDELGLEYNVVPTNTRKGEHKEPEYLKLNPNGRVPTLVDHSNGDFTIWESDAIILYLIEKYDPEHKLSVTNANEKFTLIQWLFFQASGQGPYFGQAFWFKYIHPEQIPSAIERYQKETLRVFGVLESVLSKQEWLVGGKPTVADLSFITWHRKLCERPAVARLLKLQAEHAKKTA